MLKFTKHGWGFLLITVFLITSCEMFPSTEPDNTIDTTSVIKSCERYHTSTIYFGNKSNTNTTYDVILDGSKLVTLAPGQTSKDYTVAAGAHTFQFMKTNSSTPASTMASPVLIECSTHSFSCSF